MGINSGYSLEQIGSVLGHTSTATTRRYSNMKSDSAKEVLSHMFDRFVD
jgi:site-specific recombinase XerD